MYDVEIQNDTIERSNPDEIAAWLHDCIEEDEFGVSKEDIYEVIPDADALSATDFVKLVLTEVGMDDETWENMLADNVGGISDCYADVLTDLAAQLSDDDLFTLQRAISQTGYGNDPIMTADEFWGTVDASDPRAFANIFWFGSHDGEPHANPNDDYFGYDGYANVVSYTYIPRKDCLDVVLDYISMSAEDFEQLASDNDVSL